MFNSLSHLQPSHKYFTRYFDIKTGITDTLEKAKFHLRINNHCSRENERNTSLQVARLVTPSTSSLSPSIVNCINYIVSTVA